MLQLYVTTINWDSRISSLLSCAIEYWRYKYKRSDTCGLRDGSINKVEADHAYVRSALSKRFRCSFELTLLNAILLLLCVQLPLKECICMWLKTMSRCLGSWGWRCTWGSSGSCCSCSRPPGWCSRHRTLERNFLRSKNWTWGTKVCNRKGCLSLQW